ncbi:MAG: hypothetical protein M0P13_05520 [Fibrobacteraceae bacterium]|nr:hypothetical protein [Fibrobacteraceae bacterium]
MRDLIEKVLKMGYSVLFSNENGFPVIRIVKGNAAAQTIQSCSLGTGDFRSTVEDTLQGMILELERHPQ